MRKKNAQKSSSPRTMEAVFIASVIVSLCFTNEAQEWYKQMRLLSAVYHLAHQVRRDYEAVEAFEGYEGYLEHAEQKFKSVIFPLYIDLIWNKRHSGYRNQNGVLVVPNVYQWFSNAYWNNDDIYEQMFYWHHTDARLSMVGFISSDYLRRWRWWYIWRRILREYWEIVMME